MALINIGHPTVASCCAGTRDPTRLCSSRTFARSWSWSFGKGWNFAGGT